MRLILCQSSSSISSYIPACVVYASACLSLTPSPSHSISLSHPISFSLHLSLTPSLSLSLSLCVSSVFEKQVIVDVKGLDIFGNTPISVKKLVECVCPNCSRSLGAQKFAPHLEKCMGMGRNSSRLAANKK